MGCALQLAVAEWSKLTPELKKQWKEAYFTAHPELLATSNQDDDSHEGVARKLKPDSLPCQSARLPAQLLRGA